MKLTIDIPDNLIREIQLRAAQERRELNEFVVELLRQGLSTTAASVDERPSRLLTKEEKRLPVIKCRHPAEPGQEFTPERVAEILIEQEVSWHLGDTN